MLAPAPPNAASTRAVRAALAGRQLVWLGIRGQDGAALLGLPELTASFAVTAALGGAGTPDINLTLEELSGVRVDLDSPTLDVEGLTGYEHFRDELLRTLEKPSVLLPYRPTDLSSLASFVANRTVTLAGMLRHQQRAFDHKPWIDQALRRIGVQGLGWRYVADERSDVVREMLANGPVVLRTSQSSGGEGVVLVSSPEQIEERWPAQPDAFVGVAPFLSDAISVNLSSCVFSDGAIRMHPPSVQLIGIQGCTTRRFGYCGNDFARIANFDDRTFAQLESMALTAGRWLYRERYVGAFGLDALIHDGDVFFTEINPRFQGSSELSSIIGDHLGAPNLFHDHLLACLGEGPTDPGRTLRDWAKAQPALAQVVVHNTSEAPVTLLATPAVPSGVLSHVVTNAAVQPGASLGRLVFDRGVTADGRDVGEVRSAITAVRMAHGLTPA